LIYIGSSAAESPYVLAGQICTFLYFFYFMIVIPLLPYIDFICVHYKILNILPEAKEKK